MTEQAYETTPSRAPSDWNGGRHQSGTVRGSRSEYPGGSVGIHTRKASPGRSRSPTNRLPRLQRKCDAPANQQKRHHEILGSERLTGALLDRLTHHVHILEMNGDSYRLKQSKQRQRGTRSADTPGHSPEG